MSHIRIAWILSSVLPKVFWAELAGIQQLELLYPRQGEKGPGRTVTVATKQNLIQQALANALGLQELL